MTLRYVDEFDHKHCVINQPVLCNDDTFQRAKSLN